MVQSAMKRVNGLAPLDPGRFIAQAMFGGQTHEGSDCVDLRAAYPVVHGLAEVIFERRVFQTVERRLVCYSVNLCQTFLKRQSMSG